MACADTIKKGSVASFIVSVGGAPVPDSIRVFSIETEMNINRISSATIVVLDGDASTGKFKASSSDTFVPGKDITIEAGYDNKNKVI